MTADPMEIAIDRLASVKEVKVLSSRDNFLPTTIKDSRISVSGIIIILLLLNLAPDTRIALPKRTVRPTDGISGQLGNIDAIILSHRLFEAIELLDGGPWNHNDVPPASVRSSEIVHQLKVGQNEASINNKHARRVTNTRAGDCGPELRSRLCPLAILAYI